VSADTQELERSALERKDRDELHTIATALGGKPGSRAKKADMVDLILELAGVTAPSAAGGGSVDEPSDDAEASDTPVAATRTRRSRGRSAEAEREAGADDDHADTSTETSDGATATPDADEPRARQPRPGRNQGERPGAAGDRANQERASQAERNQGGRNQGDRNQGDRNQGDRNQGDRNQGDRNQGDRNQGDRNQGDRNQVDPANQATPDSAPGGNGDPNQAAGFDRDNAGEGEAANRRRRRRGRDRDRGDRPERADQDQPFQGEPVEVSGLLDLRDEGYGFLRLKGYLPSKDDVYISVKQARQFALRKGDHITGAARPAARNEKNPAMLRLDTVNGLDPE